LKMGNYLPPANVNISDDYTAHVKRNSAEPGTDYETPYGTPVFAAHDGVVTLVDPSYSGADGARVTIKLNDGRVVSYIHLSAVKVKRGDKVKRGTVLGLSGASGYGKARYYGPHVHVSLWDSEGLPYKATIDFERFVSTNSKEDEEMIINIQGKAGVRRGGSFYIKDGAATFLGGNVSGVPTLDFNQGSELAKVVTGIK
jgi:murein DD-endopeptidase MepM/ murein hydrolase activator NlpD